MIIFRIALAALACAVTPAWSFDPLPAVDPSRLSPRDFGPDELDLPYYLAHFRQFADSVVAEGPNRGFFGLSVWRGQTGAGKPYNARVMENILSLAWFYSTKRPWNPYYASAPVRQRLEAALEFWCKLQSPEGKFSEYGPGQWNLAATAFATKFMGRTLALLRDGPRIDPELHRRVIEADRKAIRVVLTDPAFYEHGKRYTNQFTNVWAGALAFLRLYPDKELEELFWRKLPESMRDFQSPAGFFYEADGPDAGYSSSTHQSNLRVAYQFVRGTPRAEPFLEHDRRWFEWLAWNAVPEPDGTWTLNRAIETRQKHATFQDVTTPLAERIPLARAFAVNAREREAQREQARKELEANWPRVRPLPVGEFWAWSPYAFLDRGQFEWFPSPEQQAAARRDLPYFKRSEFVRQLMDSRNPMVYTYVRRPAYYAAFNSGKWLREQQRYGLGLVWTPPAGAVLQSQSYSDTAAWGTILPGESRICEAHDLYATFQINQQAVHPKPGSHELPGGALTVRYGLGGGGEKSLRFEDRAIAVTVRRNGRFTEILPLLEEAEGTISIRGSVAEWRIGGTPLRVRFSPGVRAEMTPNAAQIGRKRLAVLRLETENQLEYRLEFEAGAGGRSPSVRER